MSKIKKQPDWSFQSDAVEKVFKDFKSEPNGRKLLVIPTGGGKTVAEHSSAQV